MLRMLDQKWQFSSIFVTIPDPVVGGLFCVMFAMITGVGLSNLKNCSLESSRNLFVFGFAIFVGLALPNYVKSHDNFVHTGSPTGTGQYTVSSGLIFGLMSGYFLLRINRPINSVLSEIT